MTKQTQARVSALLYAAIPLATAIAVDAGVQDSTWQHILAAVAAFAAVFGINVATGDRTANVGGGKAKT